MYTKVLQKTSRFMMASFIVMAATGVFFQESKPTSAACTYPAQVLNLTNWKQTLPNGESEKPTEIKQPSLATYSHKYFSPTGDCSGVIFRAPVDGMTTSGSGYPRSELREMTDNGKKLASWSTTSGSHSMFIDQAITAVPKDKKHVVAGQIHDKDDDVIVIRLEHPKLFIDINGNDGPVLDNKYDLGKRFTIQFVAHDGEIEVYYNGGEKPVHTLKKKSEGNYFKAGAYTQSNCSKEEKCESDNFGEVSIYKLAVDHKDSDSISPVVAVSDTTSSSSVASSSKSKSKTEKKDSDSKSDDDKDSKAKEEAQEESIPPSITETAPAMISDVTSFSVPAAEGTPSDVVSQEISFEAESGSVTLPMEIKEDASASGGKYLVQTAKEGKGTIQYTVQVPRTGYYQMKAKVIAPTIFSNSVSYSVDGKSFKQWNFPRKIKEWTWVDGTTINLTQGKHTFIVKKSEKGTQVDAFELKRVESYSWLDHMKRFFHPGVFLSWS